MKILHKQFDVVWSWTEIAKGLYNGLNYEWTVEPSHVKTECSKYDVIITQQPFMMKNVTDRKKVITRIGTNSLFEQGRFNMDEVGRYMKECFAIIATNKFLFNEAKKYNKNVYLIPNGLDLDEWSILPCKEGKFVVGFVGNIGNPEYKKYKGFDLLEQACKELKVTIKTALYGKDQLPHDQMREKFYSQVSCIVHPTEGEGCSNTIMEALACGIPVITTKTAGFHGEVLTDGENVLFCERTVESIKEKISFIKRYWKKRQQIGLNGRLFAEQYHSIKDRAIDYNKAITACFEYNKTLQKPKEQEVNKMVKVKALMPIYENGIRKEGDEFFIKADRARKLSGFVRIVDKEIEQPPADKMIKRTSPIVRRK